MIEALARVSHSATFLLRQASEADPETNGPWSEYLLRRALEFDPGNPDVLAKLGRVLRNLGRNGEALDAFRRITKRCRATSRGPRKSAAR